MSLPYEYTDPDGDTLTIASNGDGRAFVQALVQTPAAGVTVAAGKLTEVFQAMCAAAGTDLWAVLTEAIAAEEAGGRD